MKNSIYLYAIMLFILNINLIADETNIQYNYDNTGQLIRVGFSNGLTDYFIFDKNGNNDKEIIYKVNLDFGNNFILTDSVLYPFEEIKYIGSLAGKDGFLQYINIKNWIWDFGDNSELDTGEIVYHTYCQSGAYNITTKIEYEDKGIITYTNAIIVSPDLRVRSYDIYTCRNSQNVPLEPPEDIICSDQTTDISSVYGGSGEYEFDWSPKENLINYNSEIPKLIIANESMSFTLTVTDNESAKTRNGIINVIVPDSSLIFAQSSSLEICEGEVLELNVQTQKEGLIYQWFRDSTMLDGMTNPELEIAPCSLSDEGIYQCQIIDTSIYSCEVYTDGITVDIVKRPQISEQSESKTLCYNEDYLMYVTVGGDYLEYKWKKDNHFLETVNSSSFSILNINENRSGNYRCYIINTFCSDTVISQEILIRIIDSIRIEKHPISKAIRYNTNEGFKFDINDISPFTIDSLRISWFKEGIMLQDNSKYSGAQSDSLTIMNLEREDLSDNYYATIISPCDDTAYTNRFYIHKYPSKPELENSAVCLNDTARFNVRIDDLLPSQKVSYKWFKDYLPLNENNKYIGTDSSTLSISSISSIDIDDYYVQIGILPDGILLTSNIASIYISMSKPIITSQPNDTVIVKDDVISLIIDTEERTMNEFQWFHNNNLLSDKKSNVLLISSFQKEDEGLYYCLIKNPCGITLSNNYYLYLLGVDEINKQAAILFNSSPNPFSELTNISFEIDKPMKITLKIINSLGIEVAELINNEHFDNGKHNFIFHTKGLPSGLYYCKILTSDGRSKTSKMIIIK
ncbi:immunoglobulin domain-containing protein [Bacteroidota bacterium]